MNNFRNRNGRGGGRRHYGYRQRKPALNPTMFIKKAESISAQEYLPKHKFSDFELTEQLQKNIAGHGYSEPTAIQDQAIEPLLQGKDLVGIADTGSGKTAAFLIPLVDRVIKNFEDKVLVVTPTRELAMQIKDELEIFIRGTGVRSVLCIGGASIKRQADGLRRKPHFVIGTPGRIKDLSRRNILRLEGYTKVVLDEVDRMLDMGFIKDVGEIVSRLSPKRQSLFFSATIPPKTRQLMSRFLVDPLTVSVKTGPTVKSVDQDIVRTSGRNKVEILYQLLIKEGFDKVLVFGRTKWGINKLERALQAKGLRVAAIHGNKSQGQRQRSLRQLKGNLVQVLLATDVASRGLDIDDITHVINYDAPESYEDYVHRIGRTGRLGKKGTALTFVD